MGQGYRHQHEFCLFNGKIDEVVKNESDLWEIKKDTNLILTVPETMNSLLPSQNKPEEQVIAEELDKMIAFNGPERQKTRPVVDQVCHNYLIHKGKFDNYILYENGYDPIATMSFEKECYFNTYFDMLNKDLTIPAVVHQWDRTKHQDIFLKKATS